MMQNASFPLGLDAHENDGAICQWRRRDLAGFA